MFEQLEARALLTAVIGTEFLTPFAITGNVGEKPESKLWKHDGHWFGAFSDSAGTHVWRLDGATWTKTTKISALKGLQVDVKADGDVTHVLFKNKLASQLVSLQYVPGSAPTYEPWQGRPTPATVKLAASVEAATIDIDSTGRMWVGYDDDKTNIEVRYSDPPYSTWSNPIVLANNVDEDDIVALTAIPNGTIAALWSSQTTGQFGFRTHIDGTDPAQWTADEVPAAESAIRGDIFSDDHINLAVGSDATLYAAIKTGYHTISSPEMGILVRRPNGVWDDFHDLRVLDGTRPIIQLNEVANTVIFSYDDGFNWVYHECTATTIVCTGPSILLNEGDQGTSTKQVVSDDLMIVTSGKSSRGNVFGAKLRFDARNTAPVVNTGPDQFIYDTQTVDLLAVVNDDGKRDPLATSWQKVSGPGLVSFGDDAAQQTFASFSKDGVYVLELVAADGEFTVSDTVTITVVPTPPNEAPVVEVGDDLTIGVAQSPMLLGMVGDDGIPFHPGEITTQWSLESGPGTATFSNSTATNSTVKFSEVGTYTLRLTAFDGDLRSSADLVVTVNVLPPNQAPVVDAGKDQTIVIGNPVALTGKFADDDQPVAPASMATAWNVLSGPGGVKFSDSASLQTSVEFREPGTYVLELSVDDTDRVGTDTVTITIRAMPPEVKSFQNGAFPTAAYAGSQDTQIRGDKQKMNYGKQKKLELNGKPDSASLMRWDVSAISPGATVLAASFTLNVENNSKNSFQVYELLKDWVENEATFLQSAKNVLWNAPGATGIGNDHGSTPLGTTSAPVKGHVTVQLNEAGIAVVQKWISDPSSNHGLILQDFIDTSKDNLAFTSREGSKAITRPKLSIQFFPASGPPVAPLRASALTNLENPHDVNADSKITPMDALLVINSLNRGALEAEQDAAPTAFFLDVTGDGQVTPIDALIVINDLNGASATFGEGEGSPADLLIEGFEILDIPLLSIDLFGPKYHSRHEVDSNSRDLQNLTNNRADAVSHSNPRSHEGLHASCFDSVLTATDESILDAIGYELSANSAAGELIFNDAQGDYFATLGRLPFPEFRALP